MDIKGRNLIDGLPLNIQITPKEVREALADPLSEVLDAVKSTLERTPPELSADIIEFGITLTGGGSLIRNLDQYIADATGIPVHVAEDPLDCVAKGSGMIIEDLADLGEVLSEDK